MPAQENRLLIVEDEEIVAIDIQSQLEGLGYEVLGTAATADEACCKAAALQPDLVLMDIRLEGRGDGIEAAHRIRERFPIPVVFLTAYVDTVTLERAKAVEPHGYLVKPFNDQDLHTTIQMALYKGKAERQLRENRDDLLTILDAQRLATVMLDEQGGVTFLSRAAEEITGWRRDEATGQPWKEVLGLPGPAPVRLEGMFARPASERSRVEVSLQGPKSRRRDLEIEVQDDPRAPGGKVLFLYEVSRLHDLRNRPDAPSEFEDIVGKSKPMQQVFQAIRDLARVDSIVLIEGETGTGKELVARAIHRSSRRCKGPFVALNCAGLSEELAASQLFGHKRGAFTGAVDDQMGLFEVASGGTLFLDEIGELSLRVQTTLLRVLEEGSVRRIGDSGLRPVNTRILAATNRDLARSGEENRFRPDLLYRIRVGRIRLAPLRDRPEDLPLLVRRFCDDLMAAIGKEVDSVGDDAMAVLLGYHWPGNVRELKNALEFAVIHAPGSVIGVPDLPPEILEAVCGVDFSRSLAPDERGRILAALDRARGNRKEAAALLGISRATLYRRLAQLGLDDEPRRDGQN